MVQNVQGLAGIAALIVALGGAFYYTRPGRIIKGDPDATRALHVINAVDSANDPDAAAKLLRPLLRPTPEESQGVNSIVSRIALAKCFFQVPPVGARAIQSTPAEPDDDVSDEFHSLRSRWTLAGPPGSAWVESDVLYLRASSPASGWSVTQLWEPFAEGDAFTLGLAFTTDPPLGTAQGISFNVGTLGSWVRVEFTRSSAAGLELYAVTNTGGGTLLRKPVPSPAGLRIQRTPAAWSLSVRSGAGWVDVGDFVKGATLNSIGLYSAAKAGTGGHVAGVDFIRLEWP